MEAALARLAAAVSRRRRLVAGAWLLLLLASGWFSLHQGDRLSGGGWDVPGSEAVRGTELLERFPAHDGVRFAVLVESPSPELTRAGVRRAQARLERLAGLRADGPAVPLAGGRAALVPLLWSDEATDESAFDFATDLRRAVVADERGARTRVIGEPAVWSNFQEVSKRQLAKAEIIGVPLVVVVLLAAFGTLVAAAMPVALGVVAVTVTGAVVWLLAGVAEMSIYVTNMASMIGIGVSVDYSLFVVSRYRRELREGRREEEALRRALASAGTAVVFSGATVVVSLASLFLVDVNAVRSMAAGAIVVVSVAVLATVTLLPALLAVLGRRIDRLRVPLLGRRGEEGGAFWLGWSSRVMRRPGLALLGGTALMLLLASPVLALHTENRGLNQLPRDAEVRAATERAASLAGPGLSAPVHVFVDDAETAAAVADGVRALPAVADASDPVPSGDGSWYLVETTLAVDPESTEARVAYREAHDLAGRTAAPRDAEVVLGGATAFNLAVEEALAGELWQIVLFVLAVSYVVLLLLLRSVLLPLKAVFMNLLSVGAAYGVLVAVFQWGWLDWTGYDSPGYVDTIVPALVLATTFGLSMDYEVFLLTRIRERYQAGASNERAVAEGLAASARVITAAALIMVVVFGAFAIAGAPSLKELGLGLAVAIALDATVVRLVLVPATMRLLGEWNWWLPGAGGRRGLPGRSRA
ncbi:MAG TPA: MMPL family transporter [Gaiellaceae bacterium]|nr:MMPL family transporter [Gaiellaceae bacterium]